MSERNADAMSRREFARRAAMAATVASIAPGAVAAGGLASVGAQTSQPGMPAGAPGALPRMSADLPKLAPESQAEAEARLQAILAGYGGRFSDEQKMDLRRLCILAQAPLDRLRAYPVQDGDGTALYLKPLFEREKKPKPPAASRAGAGKPTALSSAPTSGATVKP